MATVSYFKTAVGGGLGGPGGLAGAAGNSGG